MPDAEAGPPAYFLFKSDRLFIPYNTNMKLTTLILVLVFLIPRFVLADHDELVHFAAHAGTSYAMNTIFYGACTRLNIIKPWNGDYNPEVKCYDPDGKGCGFPPPSNNVPCMMASGFATMMVGFLYKHIECKGGCDPAQFQRSILYNGAGVGLSTGSIVLFNF